MSIQTTVSGMAAVLSLVACIAAVSALNQASELRAELAVADAPMAAAPAEELGHEEPEHAEPGHGEPGHGELGEQMNSLARRFAGLWYAGRAGNTALAEYELHEMEEVIEDMREMDLVENGVRLSGVLDALRNTQLKALDEAVEAHDLVAFELAYRDTINTCNACHKVAGHEFIRIGYPDRKPVANRIYENPTD